MAVPHYIARCFMAGSNEYTHDPVEFVVVCRHGAELPACAADVYGALLDAFTSDGDHGTVTVHDMQHYGGVECRRCGKRHDS